MLVSRVLVASLFAFLLLFIANHAASPSCSVKTEIHLPARPALVAHRGGRGVRPENTLVAIRHSIARYGVDVIETDIRRTKDGIFVLLHDETVDRTTNGHGVVEEMTLSELQALDFGFRFTDGNKHPWRGKGVGVATLKETYLELVGKGVLLSVEMKEQGNEVVDALVEALSEMPGFETFMCFCSSDHTTNTMFKKKTNYSLCYSGSEQDVATHVVVSALGIANLWYALNPNTNRFLFQPYLSLGGINLQSLQHDSLLTKIGLEPLYFTINTPQEGAACALQGCHGITTDRPDIMEEILVLLAGRNKTTTTSSSSREDQQDQIISRDAETTSWECESLLCTLVDTLFGALPAQAILFATIFVVFFPAVVVLDATQRFVSKKR